MAYIYIYMLIYIYSPNQYDAGLKEAAWYGKPVCLHQKKLVDIKQPDSPKHV